MFAQHVQDLFKKNACKTIQKELKYRNKKTCEMIFGLKFNKQ